MSVYYLRESVFCAEIEMMRRRLVIHTLCLSRQRSDSSAFPARMTSFRTPYITGGILSSQRRGRIGVTRYLARSIHSITNYVIAGDGDWLLLTSSSREYT